MSIKVKDLREFLNGLDLDYMDSYITIVSVTHGESDDYCQCDILEDFTLDNPDSYTGKGHLYFYTDEACNLIENESDLSICDE